MNRLSTKAQSLCHVRISQPGRLVSLSTRGSPIRPTLHHTFPGRRNASTHASHDLPAHRTPEGNRSLMHGVFWSVGLATTIGVGYAVCLFLSLSSKLQ